VVLDLAEIVTRRNVEAVTDLEAARTTGDPVTEHEPADQDGPDDHDSKENLHERDGGAQRCPEASLEGT
jgi:hypothetical protein